MADRSSDFRRMTATEHRRLGIKPSRRLYVRKDVGRVTELTPTISMNKYYNLKTREETGLASRHVATEARAHGGLGYKSAQAEQTAAKISDRAFEKRVGKAIDKDVKDGVRIRDTNRDGSFKTGKRGTKRGWLLKPGDGDWYVETRRRKLAGEWIDPGDWHKLATMAHRYGDPKLPALYAYPPSFGVRATAA
jgi:hypothetical protein